MSPRPDGERAPWGRLGFVLVATSLTLLAGFAHKSLCLTGDFDARAFRMLCYTDIVPLYSSTGLDAGKVPYVEGQNEYPVGTGAAMWLASLVGDGGGGFFLANAVLLAAAALVTAWLLQRTVGSRALYFALAPSLMLYAFLNWDLLAVMMATLSVVLFLRGRDGPAGAAVGLGAATKVFPGLLALPYVVQRLRERRPGRAAQLVGVALAAWLLANALVAVRAFDGWSYFYRFSAERAPTPGSVWAVGCRLVSGERSCLAIPFVNAASAVSFVVGASAVFWLWRRAGGAVPLWTLGMPLTALLMLTGKVASPQFSLWLVPWFALALPSVRLFMAFEAADVAVFVTEFSNLARVTGGSGLPAWSLDLAVAVRAAILLVVIAASLRPRPGADQPLPGALTKIAPSSSS